MKLFLGQLTTLCLACCAFACSVGEAKQAVDPGWPMQIQRDDAQIVIYQLQPESLSGDKLTGRAAISIGRKGESEPLFGAVWFEARIATDRDARTVTLLDVNVPSVKFPSATPQERDGLVAIVQSELPKQHPTYSLDQLLATLDPAVQPEPAAENLRNDPPHIVFVTRPTALVTIDGKPQLRKIDNSTVMRVINTPFIILFDPATKTHYLRAGSHWLRSGEIEGPWQVDADPPAQIVSALPRSTLAQDPGAAGAGADDVDVIVATEPTELIVSNGEPRWAPTVDNELLQLENSENDVFVENATHRYFVLLSGRWYTSSALQDGQWTYVPADRLPAAFARIPASSDKASVRAFVAGTSEAREAALDASIPQTTVVKRSDAHCSVVYDDDPKFEPIPGTPLSYAVNTTSSVIEYAHRYYCCTDGVWYVAEKSLGPWSVCTDVPNEIYSVPPSCPIYPVKYVYVYDSTPDYVYVGYLPGYTGCYVDGSTIVFGTGWWYPGWIGHTYCPRPWTWGFCAHYDPWICGWGFGFDFAWGVNPWWFNHSCGWGHPGWWGSGGFHGKAFEIHGTVVKRLEHTPNMKGHPGPTLRVGRENLYNRDENRTRLARVAGITSQRPREVQPIPNDVFADPDGRAMRRTRDGWEQREQQEWRRATPRPGESDRSGPGAGRTPPPPPAERAPPARPMPERPMPAPMPERPPPMPSERERPIPPPLPPVRPIPVPPRGTLRQRSDGADFDQLLQARERGNERASALRQRRPGF